MRLAIAGCIFFSTFAIALVLIGLHAQREIKRESGENPEQSRCCEFHQSCKTTEPLFSW